MDFMVWPTYQRQRMIKKKRQKQTTEEKSKEFPISMLSPGQSLGKVKYFRGCESYKRQEPGVSSPLLERDL